MTSGCRSLGSTAIVRSECKRVYYSLLSTAAVRATQALNPKPYSNQRRGVSVVTSFEWVVEDREGFNSQ